MSGYRWDPVIRVVPVNGAEAIYWLTDHLTDCGGHTRINLRYVESMNVREDINRSLRPVVYGLRPEVEIECVISTMEDQRFLAEIESALLQVRDYAVYLSLDGGCVERQVVLSSVSNADPLAGRTIVGATFRIGMRCVDLITTKPAMMTDPGTGAQHLPDGSVEVWSAGAPVNWSGTSGVGTVAQETSIIAADSGLSSAKITRSHSSTYFQFTPNTPGVRSLRHGHWYRYRGSARCTASVSGSYRVRLYNASQALESAVDGKSWSASPSTDFILDTAPVGSFTQFESYFRIPSTFAETDEIRPLLAGAFTSGESIYYDAMSIYGPVLRPGFATW